MGQLYTLKPNASKRISFHADAGERPNAGSVAPAILDQLFVDAVDDRVRTLDFALDEHQLTIRCDGRLTRTLPPFHGEPLLRRLRLLAGLLTRSGGAGRIAALVDGRRYTWITEPTVDPLCRSLRVSLMPDPLPASRHAVCSPGFELAGAA